VKEGDDIELIASMKDNVNVMTAVASSERDIPEYIDVDHKVMKGKFIRIPKLSDVPYPVQMEPPLVVEFYSR
jgi:small subunit ribosomal protein S4